MQETREGDEELSFQDFKRQTKQLKQFLRDVFLLAAHSIKRYYLLLIILLAGFAVWGAYEYKNSKVFEARSSFVYTELQKKSFGEMIDKLQQMIKYNSYGQLGRALQLPDSQARAILDIKAVNMFGGKLSEDVSEIKQPFYVDIIMSNNRTFDTLQRSLENYMNNNVFVRELIARKTGVLRQKIAYGEQELIMMDSLKKAYTRSLDKPSPSLSLSNNPFDPIQLYEKSEKLNQDLADMKIMLSDSRAVKTLDPFMVTERPNQKSLITFGLRFLAFYLIAAVLLIFILSIFKK